MIRKSSLLPFRRTLIVASAEPPKIYMDGGHEWGAYDASEAPSADETWGFFRMSYTGPFKYLRLIDPSWWGSRMIQLNRTQNMGNWFIWYAHYLVYWWIPCYFLYGDGKPPRDVDWNDEKTGYIC